MITEDYTIIHDFGRPDILSDKQREYIKKWQDLVVSCDIEIAVNPWFDRINTIIEQNGTYMGGGYKYEFGFRSDEDLEKFKRLVAQIV